MVQLSRRGRFRRNCEHNRRCISVQQEPETVLTERPHKRCSGSNQRERQLQHVHRARDVRRRVRHAGAERRTASRRLLRRGRISTSSAASGDNESISRGSRAEPGRSWGVNGGANWEPVSIPARSSTSESLASPHRLKSGDARTRFVLSDRPNIRYRQWQHRRQWGDPRNVARCDTPGLRRLACSGPLPSQARGTLWLDRLAGS